MRCSHRKKWRSVQCCRMQSSYDETADRVTFLYKLEPGVAESRGMNVAKMAGLAPEVLQVAKRKSTQMACEKTLATCSSKHIGDVFHKNLALLSQLQRSVNNA